MKKVMIKALFGAFILCLASQNISAMSKFWPTFPTFGMSPTEAFQRQLDILKAAATEINIPLPTGTVQEQIKALSSNFLQRNIDPQDVLRGVFNPAKYIAKQTTEALVTQGAAELAQLTGAPLEVIKGLTEMALEERGEALKAAGAPVAEVLSAVDPQKLVKETTKVVAPDTGYFGGLGSKIYDAGVGALGYIGRPVMWGGSQLASGAQSAAKFANVDQYMKSMTAPGWARNMWANISPAEQQAVVGLGSILAAGVLYKGVQWWRQPGVNLDAALKETKNLIKAIEGPVGTLISIDIITDTLNRIQAQSPKDDKRLSEKIKEAKSEAKELIGAEGKNRENTKRILTGTLRAIQQSLLSKKEQMRQVLARQSPQPSMLQRYKAPVATGAAIATALAPLALPSGETIKGAMPSFISEWSIPKPSLPSTTGWANMLPSGRSAAIAGVGAALLGSGLAYKKGWIPGLRGTPTPLTLRETPTPLTLQGLIDALKDEKKLQSLQKETTPIYDLLSRLKQAYPNQKEAIDKAHTATAVFVNARERYVAQQAEQLRDTLLSLSGEILQQELK